MKDRTNLISGRQKIGISIYRKWKCLALMSNQKYWHTQKVWAYEKCYGDLGKKKTLRSHFYNFCGFTNEKSKGLMVAFKKNKTTNTSSPLPPPLYLTPSFVLLVWQNEKDEVNSRNLNSMGKRQILLRNKCRFYETLIHHNQSHFLEISLVISWGILRETGELEEETKVNRMKAKRRNTLFPN